MRTLSRSFTFYLLSHGKPQRAPAGGDVVQRYGHRAQVPSAAAHHDTFVAVARPSILERASRDRVSVVSFRNLHTTKIHAITRVPSKFTHETFLVRTKTETLG